MKFFLIFLLITPIFSHSTTPDSKKNVFPWSCDGKIYDYSKDKSKDRWVLAAEFKSNVTNAQSNFIENKVIINKKNLLVRFIYNEKGTVSLMDDKTTKEDVSTSIKIDDELLQGGAFSAYNGTDLPNEIALRQDFKLNNKSHFLYLICKRSTISNK